MQRHALNLDELSDESVEQDLPVQRVAFAVGDITQGSDIKPAEHARLVSKGQDITAKAEAACDELAATAGGANKAARHVGKAFKRGLLVKASPIVEVNQSELKLSHRAGRVARGDFRWFWWNKAGGEDYLIKHRKWAGGLETHGHIGVAGGHIVGLGVRDRAADDRATLKRILVHEAVHQLQWEENVQQGQTMEEKYRREFEAYWVSGEFGHLRNADRRAEAIRTHIVGANAGDRNTVYTDLRDWYHDAATPQADRDTIDNMRIGTVGGLAWWQLNLHIMKLLKDLRLSGTDEERLEEWKKLSRSEKSRALADPDVAGKIRATVSMPGGAFGRAVRAP